jgi:peptide/nickel transport system ATP-binding protein
MTALNTAKYRGPIAAMVESESAVHPPSGDLLEVRDLRVRSHDGRSLVAGVDLTVSPGEAVAVVGESGSGKSLTARAITGLLPPGLSVGGSVRYRGHELTGMKERSRARLRGAEISMILQDPFTMLHPMQRCGAIVTETLRRSDGGRLTKVQRHGEAISRLAEVGITDEHVLRQYPFELSGGMRQRVAIAAALSRNPALLIADEPSTALDVTTQQEVLKLLGELQRARGMALVLITHDLRVAFSVCQRIHVFYAGSIAEVGPSEAVSERPLHPYSLGLLLADPPVDRRIRDLVSIPGSVPTPDSVAHQCSFADRCSWAADECRTARPALVTIDADRAVACVRHGEIAAQMTASRGAHAESIAITEEPNEGNDLVAVRDLKVTYARRGRKGSPVHALKGVSISVKPGESVGIVGESGSGKTTLGRSLVGLVEPTSGSITINGIDASSYPRASRSDRDRLRHSVQIVFQDPYSSLNPSHTIRAALAEALSVRLNRRPTSAEVRALLGRVRLPESYAERKPAALSGGERQRVAIARAIAVEPRLLICDEPVSALDVSVQAQVLTLLREIRQELDLAFLFVTHDLAVVRQIADRIYVMSRGVVVESGPTQQVLDHPQHAYTRKLINSVPRVEASPGDEQ